jgi:ankyrin repeat protein
LLGHGAELDANNDSNGATASILGKRTDRGRANTEAKENRGNTPLHFACLEGDPATVQALLLSGGASILAVNNVGHLPIHIAVSEGHSPVAKYLLHEVYATPRRLPLHALLEDLTWIGNSGSSGTPPLRAALDQDILRTKDVV